MGPEPVAAKKNKYKYKYKHRSLSRAAAVALGLSSLCLAAVTGGSGRGVDLLQTWVAVYGATAGPLLGLLILGMLVPFSSAQVSTKATGEQELHHSPMVRIGSLLETFCGLFSMYNAHRCNV